MMAHLICLLMIDELVALYRVSLAGTSAIPKKEWTGIPTSLTQNDACID